MDKTNKEITKSFETPKGYEIDWDSSKENGCLVFKKKPSETPESWEEYASVIADAKTGRQGFNKQWGYYEENFVYFPAGTESQIRSYGKLLCLYNAYKNKYNLNFDWTLKDGYKYCIINRGGLLRVSVYTTETRVFAFPDYDMAEEFLEKYKDLLVDAINLL